ncbi:MAG: 16S rRNA (cytidine(1402)-2'-O)-methyltransferase [Deltaproteobacteria bacterium]|nr:16S rRNA (cytidine(1402)-2'-O)-methyltransferase [Deltaproteobacteria bacterium]
MATLFVVATPIGNLGDLTPRAAETLKSVGLIVCEDTRISGPLMHRIGTRAPLKAHFKGREAEGVEEILAALDAGTDVALISDAGTPLVSDPGQRLVARAADGGHRIVPIPGGSAPVALISVAAFKTEAFTWIGFLPSPQQERRGTLSRYRDRPEALVFFESPRRLVETLTDCMAVFGPNRPAVIGRELTKLHEEIVRGTLKELHGNFAARADIPGEVTVAVEGFTGETETVTLESLTPEILEGIGKGEGTRQIAQRLAAVYGLPRRDVYERVLELAGRK